MGVLKYKDKEFNKTVYEKEIKAINIDRHTDTRKNNTKALKKRMKKNFNKIEPGLVTLFFSVFFFTPSNFSP